MGRQSEGDDGGASRGMWTGREKSRVRATGERTRIEGNGQRTVGGWAVSQTVDTRVQPPDAREQGNPIKNAINHRPHASIN